MITDAFIKELPKTDLHVHLDGCLRLPTLVELAHDQGIELPSTSESGLRELVFKQGYRNLAEYLHGFKYTCAVLKEPEALERVAYELAMDNFSEGVRYFEVRFAPFLHTHERLDLEGVLCAVDRGLARAKSEANRNLQEGEDGPPFDYGIITCAMRMFTAGFSPYYRTLCEAHPFMPKYKLYGAASLELARGVVQVRDRKGIPIVGFDLAGAEDGYPAEDHREAFDYVHRHFMKKTVHAGEAYGPESIFQAITDLHADRIGHGYHLLDEDFITSPKVVDKARYIANLCQYLAETRVTIEVCLSSNLDTDPNLSCIAEHPFGRMKDLKLSTTLCTDNRLISSTTISREWRLAIDHFQLTPRDVKNIIIYGFKRSFYPLEYRKKRAYVRRVIDFYKRIEEKHGITTEAVNEY
jgi:adenosine deaminase